MEVRSRIREFIATNFYVERERLTDDVSLVETGTLDSTGVIEVVVFLQNVFGVEVPDEDLLPENLASINRITAYVDRRLGESQAFRSSVA